MTRTQDRAVAAMRAIGDTVSDAPPLDLPAEPRSARSSRLARAGIAGGRAWRQWLIPAAAALAVVAIAVSLVVVRSVVRSSTAAPVPGGTATAAPVKGTNTLPAYYVSLAAFGWYAYAADPLTAGTAALTVSATRTGKVVATVNAPKGLTFNVVTGAADDRTFVVGAIASSVLKSPGGTVPETWFLLQLAPGTAHMARLTELAIPRSLAVTGAALSPDGSELAVSSVMLFGSSNMPSTGSQELDLLSTSNGKALRGWGSLGGEITASTPTKNYRSDALNSVALSTALRWSPDGTELAFAWNGSAIRLIDLASQISQQRGLLQASAIRATIGISYTGVGTTYTCVASEGWQVSDDALVTCAGEFSPVSMRVVATPGETPPPAPGVCPKATPDHPALIQQVMAGGGSETLVLAHSADCTIAGDTRTDTSLGWVSADGKTAIAVLSSGIGAYGRDQYGVFTSKTFRQLPTTVPDVGSIATIAW